MIDEESGFKTPLTIKSVVEKIHKKQYILPSIQRELVWDTKKIETLFDSIIRGYPINSFLFWHVDKKNSNKFQFYEFIRKYHEREETHNEKANLSGDEDVVAILDGQQRFTSLYMGLKGGYAKKTAKKRWDNENAFPDQKLYLNLLGKQDEKDNPLDREYDFRFLTKQESEQRDEKTFWFEVGKILNFTDTHQTMEFLIENDLTILPKEISKFANETLFKLYEIVHNKPIINYYLETSQELSKVLTIFIRVNSGGMQLSYSDLLLSIATAQWKDRDVREEVNECVDEINRDGLFGFNRDLILKSALVLSDIPEIAFKVDNFNAKNMQKIEKNWDKLTQSIRGAVNLIESLGYDSKRLTSTNAIIPIAYYLMKNENPKNFVNSSKFKQDRTNIKKWLAAVLIKQAFGGQPDTVLKPIREIISKKFTMFPYDEIVNKFKGTPKTLIFSEDDLDAILENKYGRQYTFSILSMLYPNLDFKNKFHEDHIFPKSKMNYRALKKFRIIGEDAEFFSENKDRIPNLQLLEGMENQEKSSKIFQEWLEAEYKGNMKNEFMTKHFIPKNIDLNHENFIEFYNERTKILKEYLRKNLPMS